MKTTKIAWTNATWNPVSGCTKVSPGCDHCYAETLAERFRGVPGHYYEQGFDLTLRPERLDDPLRWKKPRLIFTNSMSDLFHRDIPDEYIAEVFGRMIAAKQHTFQVLTKRPDRMRLLLKERSDVGAGFAKIADYCFPWPAPNVWLGTSVESADYAWRADMLRATPAAVRFLSCEPLLGHIPAIVLRDLDWIIVGGESGRGARPLDESWVRDIKDDCEAMSIPLFVKQMGSVWAQAHSLRGKADSLEDLPADLRVREFPADMEIAI